MINIPFAKPSIGEGEIAAVIEVLKSGWVSQGPKVAEFERAFAGYVGAEHACAVSNCTAALHLALLALGVGVDDEVITVSHSFIATANAIRYCSAKPIFVDIDPETYNLDAARLESAISNRTKAILCVHQLGMPCDLPRIVKIAARYGLRVVEDAACGIGSEIRINGRWDKIGQPHGDIACFSFHPRKVITTGEGGMLTTRDPELDNNLRRLRQHYMSVPDTARHQSTQVIFEDYQKLGFNYRMTDIQAAIGLEQLKRLPDLVGRRRELASRYRALLSDIPGVIPPMEPEWARSTWQSYSVRLPEGKDQRRVMQYMLDMGVSTRRGVMCAHRESAHPPGTWTCGTAYRGHICGPGRCPSLWHSEAAQDHTIILPLFPLLTFEQQNQVVAALESALVHR
ncbi:dTDP-4-amino-4,6-dideoxygalactose transaminase [Methylomagnum ishizawai]|uniref:GDP-perosamine synthase n=2 Tax=Methylomagnum ishizawai TaxID=1760988 RepID=A0A1Y6D4S2_9GAMM|nr:dTDP-4-amino-4,6-dideoxygalactose transaminase [Methylomagnum ishizawai]